MRLKDKVAIITGAGSSGPGIGTGKAISSTFAKEGAKVILVDKDIDRDIKIMMKIKIKIKIKMYRYRYRYIRLTCMHVYTYTFYIDSNIHIDI